MAARRRVFRDRDPILERLHDTELQAVYRFNRLGIDYLVRRLGPHIEHKTRRNKALSPVEMILVTAIPCHGIYAKGKLYIPCIMHTKLL